MTNFVKFNFEIPMMFIGEFSIIFWRLLFEVSFKKMILSLFVQSKYPDPRILMSELPLGFLRHNDEVQKKLI